jgi:hypothetical protein
MKCVKDRELILFYYQETGRHFTSRIEQHLKSCSLCRKRYDDLLAFLQTASSAPQDLTSQEIEAMVNNIREASQAESFLARVQQRYMELTEAMSARLRYKPRLVPVALALVLLFAGTTLYHQRKLQLQREYEILEIQVELSMESFDESVFDVYDVDSLFLEDSWQRKPHVPFRRAT